MEPEWFYKPIEGYNRRYIRVGEFRQIRWCVTHSSNGNGLPGETCRYSALRQLSYPALPIEECVIVDKWLEV